MFMLLDKNGKGTPNDRALSMVFENGIEVCIILYSTVSAEVIVNDCNGFTGCDSMELMQRIAGRDTHSNSVFFEEPGTLVAFLNKVRDFKCVEGMGNEVDLSKLSARVRPIK